MPPLTHTHTRLTALCPGLPGWAGARKEKPIWIFLKQETVSGSGISWATCKSAPRCRQITMPVPHHSSFFTGWMPFMPLKQPHQSMKGMPHNETQFPCNRGQRVVKRLCECVLGFVQAADAVVKPRKVGLGGVSPGCRLRVSARRDTCCPSRQAEPAPVHAGCRAPRRTSRAALEYLYTSTFIQVPSVVLRCWLGGRKGIRPVKTE